MSFSIDNLGRRLDPHLLFERPKCDAPTSVSLAPPSDLPITTYRVTTRKREIIDVTYAKNSLQVSLLTKDGQLIPIKPENLPQEWGSIFHPGQNVDKFFASAHKLEVKTPRSGGPFYLNFMGYESPCISWVDCYQATFRSAPRASANIRRDAVASLTRSRITVPKLGILSKTRNRSIKYS